MTMGQMGQRYWMDHVGTKTHNCFSGQKKTFSCENVLYNCLLELLKTAA